MARQLFDYIKTPLFSHAIATKLLILPTRRPLIPWPKSSALLVLIACSLSHLPSPLSQAANRPPSKGQETSLSSTLNSLFVCYLRRKMPFMLSKEKRCFLRGAPFFPAQALRQIRCVLPCLYVPYLPLFLDKKTGRTPEDRVTTVRRRTVGASLRVLSRERGFKRRNRSCKCHTPPPIKRKLEVVLQGQGRQQQTNKEHTHYRPVSDNRIGRPLQPLSRRQNEEDGGQNNAAAAASQVSSSSKLQLASRRLGTARTKSTKASERCPALSGLLDHLQCCSSTQGLSLPFVDSLVPLPNPCLLLLWQRSLLTLAIAHVSNPTHIIPVSFASTPHTPRGSTPRSTTL